MITLDTRPDRRKVGLILALAAGIAFAVVVYSLVMTFLQPTIRIPGATSDRAIRPEDFGKRQIEAAASRWLMTWSNSNAYDFLPHAALCMPDVDASLAEAMKSYFRDQAKVFDALDRTTTARVNSISAQPAGEGIWEVTYSLSEHDFYGPVDTGEHLVSGHLVITTEHPGISPSLIIGFDPKS
jgi:hypothetical protein